MSSYRDALRSAAADYLKALNSDMDVSPMPYVMRFPDNQRGHAIRFLLRQAGKYTAQMEKRLNTSIDRALLAWESPFLSEGDKIKATAECFPPYMPEETKH